MSKKLEGKVAVVTGASKGIGAGIAIQLGKEGANVVVNYATSKEGAERVVSEILKHGGKAIAVQANIANPKDVQKLFSETSKAFGRVDILVNNAGIYEFFPIEEISSEHFHKIFDLNVLGLIISIQEAVKYMGPSGGSIINISSVASTVAPPSSTVYSASKGAVDTITRSLGKELAPKNIRVNAVNPGVVETEGTQDIITSERWKNVINETPLGRIGQPEDIAPAVVFLASDDSSWMTGETIYISGGYR